MFKISSSKALFLLTWHRRFGAIAILIIIALCVSGILINHSQTLRFNQQPVYSASIASLYGLPWERVEKGYQVGQQWLTQVNNQLYLDVLPIGTCQNLNSAIQYQEDIAVLCQDALLLYTQEGELIERLSGLNAEHALMAVLNETLYVQKGDKYFRFSEDIVDWQEAQSLSGIQWINEQSLPGSLAKALQKQVSVKGITWEQVLLDFHSGRLFGAVGVWVVDITSVLMLLLAISGMITYIRRLRLTRFRNKSKR